MPSLTVEPPSDETLDQLGIDRGDWHSCRDHLEAVSRTFSQPIGMLPDLLSIASTCGYLLCRVTDTIEDEPGLEFAERDALFDRFLGVVEEGRPASTFTEAAGRLDDDPDYSELATDLAVVMRVFRRLPDDIVDAATRWVGEMTRGMRIYARRSHHSTGVTELNTRRDLERYCYFVAGTVGELMTELFVFHMESDGELQERRRQTMHARAESFGLGLQLVNILKDQTDDFARNWCFIPRTLVQDSGLQRAQQLYDPEHRGAAHRAVEPLFERAAEHLDDAFKYTLAIPSDEPDVRIACLLPLWLALRTLDHARGNDAMFQPGEPVKIGRDAVAETIAECTEHAGDDEFLRRRYGELSE